MTAMVLLSAWQESQVEFWRPIHGLDGYDISSFGNLRSFCVERRAGRSLSSRILRLSRHRRGYLFIRLSHKRVKGNRFIHQLVARAFIPNPKNKPQVNHVNGIKSDNRQQNLEWATNVENMAHAVSLELYPVGENSGMAKWPDALVEEMRRLRGEGVKLRELETRFNMTKATVHWLIYGRKESKAIRERMPRNAVQVGRPKKVLSY